MDATGRNLADIPADDFEKVIGQLEIVFGVDLKNRNDALRRQYAGVILPGIAECHQAHLQSSISNRFGQVPNENRKLSYKKLITFLG
jgi:hypothetical protein